MYIYRYPRPIHLSEDALVKSHNASFHLSSEIDLTIHCGGKQPEWIIHSQNPLDSMTWFNPIQVTAREVPSELELGPTKFWVQRQVMHRPDNTHGLQIAGTKLTGILKLPLETMMNAKELDGWLRVRLIGHAKKLRPQEDPLIEVEISSNSREIANRLAHYLAATVVDTPKTTFAYTTELPWLVRPPIQNVAYNQPRDSILKRVAGNIDALKSHTLIGGKPGAGKTNTMLQILDACANAGINGIMVLDPWDAFKGWAQKHNVSYIEVGKDPHKLQFLNCNPLVCPDRMRFGAHLDILADLFACAVSGGCGATLPFYARKILDAFFQQLWTLDEAAYFDLLKVDGFRLRKSGYFSFKQNPIQQLRNWWIVHRETVIQSIFAGRPAGEMANLAHILHARIAELPRTYFAHFNYQCARGLDSLFDRRVVISLGGCSSAERDLVMAILSVYYVNAGLLQEPSTNLKNVIAIDEAHRVMTRPKPGSSEFTTIGERLGKHLGEAIRELRSRGIGCILADQDPSSLAIESQSMTNLQIYHASNSTELITFLEKLFPGVPIELPNLRTGQAVCKFKDHPITVDQIPLWTMKSWPDDNSMAFF